MRDRTASADRRPIRWINGRAFISLLLAMAFVILLVSGTILLIAPSGRVARLTEWSLASFALADWQAVHTGFAALFLISGVVHLIWNRRALKRHATRGAGVPRELALAATLVLILFVTIANAWPPAAAFKDFHQYFRREFWLPDRITGGLSNGVRPNPDAAPTASAPGPALFDTHCARCHEPGRLNVAADPAAALVFLADHGSSSPTEDAAIVEYLVRYRPVPGNQQ